VDDYQYLFLTCEKQLTWGWSMHSIFQSLITRMVLPGCSPALAAGLIMATCTEEG
jgi:hypothetical protein